MPVIPVSGTIDYLGQTYTGNWTYQGDGIVGSDYIISPSSVEIITTPTGGFMDGGPTFLPASALAGGVGNGEDDLPPEAGFAEPNIMALAVTVPDWRSLHADAPDTLRRRPRPPAPETGSLAEKAGIRVSVRRARAPEIWILPQEVSEAVRPCAKRAWMTVEFTRTNNLDETLHFFIR